MGSTGGVAAAVRLLEAGVAALSDVDVEALSDGEQLALVRVVHPLVCRMEAQRSRVIGSVHRRGAVFADGAVSTGGVAALAAADLRRAGAGAGGGRGAGGAGAGKDLRGGRGLACAGVG